MITEVDEHKSRATIRTPRTLTVVGKVGRELRVQISVMPSWTEDDLELAMRDVRRILERWRVA